MAHITI